MAEAARVHLDVALDCAGETIRGTVADRTGTAVEFAGWLELMSALDTACARAATFPRVTPDPRTTHEGPMPTGGICHLCRHLDRSAPIGMRCAAFPYGVPFGVRAGVIDHRQPVDGDKGIQFEPLED